jgi:hypothetical protein
MICSTFASKGRRESLCSIRRAALPPKGKTTMNTIQVDTGDLILGLRGLTRPDGTASPREETGAAIELCNNLILYRTVFYDGNVVQSNLSEIDTLIAQILGRIPDNDTRELLQNKLQPLLLDEELEPAAVRNSAREAIGPLSYIDQLVPAPLAAANPLYLNDPFKDLDTILKFFSLPSAPEQTSISHFFTDRSIRGGRFFWGLLQKECFDEVKTYLLSHRGNESVRLRVLFARFRYRFAANRGQQVSLANPEIAAKIDYQPELSRQILMGQFRDSLGRVSAWKQEIEPDLTEKLYSDGAAYLSKGNGWLYLSRNISIPLLVNRALQPLSKANQLNRTSLVRQCMELSQHEDIERIWNSLETYSSAKEKEQREIREQMRDYAKTLTDPLVSGKVVVEAITKIHPQEILKDLFVKTISDNLSPSRHAASILGRSVAGLSNMEDVLKEVQAAFGSIPN